MKVLFIISNSDTAFWLSEVTHPYWHLTERGVEVDLPAPREGRWCLILTATLTLRSRPNQMILSAKASLRTRSWPRNWNRRSS